MEVIDHQCHVSVDDDFQSQANDNGWKVCLQGHFFNKIL